MRSQEYGLFSEFNADKHAETFTNYLEIIIDKHGDVFYAVPSHQEYLIGMVAKEKEISRGDVNDACPKEYYYDYMNWLMSLTGAIAVWVDFYIGKPNVAQIKTLKYLRLKGLYTGLILAREDMEAIG